MLHLLWRLPAQPLHHFDQIQQFYHACPCFGRILLGYNGRHRLDPGHWQFLRLAIRPGDDPVFACLLENLNNFPLQPVLRMRHSQQPYIL
jgi:hypothetical protein